MMRPSVKLSDKGQAAAPVLAVDATQVLNFNAPTA